MTEHLMALVSSTGETKAWTKERVQQYLKERWSQRKGLPSMQEIRDRVESGSNEDLQGVQSQV